MIVVSSPRAERQIRAARRWWLTNRDKAPEAFDEEILRVRELLTHAPLVGMPWRTRRGEWMRRVTLERIRYYVFYRVRPGRVEITSFWHTSRRPPRL